MTKQETTRIANGLSFHRAVHYIRRSDITRLDRIELVRDTIKAFRICPAPLKVQSSEAFVNACTGRVLPCNVDHKNRRAVADYCQRYICA